MVLWKKKNRSADKPVTQNSNVDYMTSLSGDVHYSRRSYSQSGEDMLAAYLAHNLHLNEVKYLDIGAYSPTHLSNTYFFYERGSSGVCVEANPNLSKEFKLVRGRDTVLNVAISPTDNGIAPFYILDAPTLSTLSKAEADRLVKEEGVQLVQTIDLPVLSISQLLLSEFQDRNLNFLSLDVEGLDFQIMKNFDFNYVRPEILCLETLEYKKSGIQSKNSELITFIVQNGYSVYADTQINTIFVDNNKWINR